MGEPRRPATRRTQTSRAWGASVRAAKERDPDVKTVLPGPGGLRLLGRTIALADSGVAAG
ncbi:MAG: hypothetical protein ACRBN8_27590 [Nannocystales bacterium]